MTYSDYWTSQNVCLDCKYYDKKENSCNGKKKIPGLMTIECPRFERKDTEQLDLF